MVKRVALFFVLNICVVVTLSFILQILGVGRYLTANGINYSALAIFCLVWGMGGALISLALSRVMAKWSLGVKLIDPARPGQFDWLVQTITEQTRMAGLPALPEIGVYESPEVNAFATGPTQSRALVAFSSGLLSRMNQSEVAGVAAHELAHIKNGDMVTMTLLQGVMNAIVMFLARTIGFFASQAVKDERMQPIVHMVTVIALEILLFILAQPVLCWFSRQREFRADNGGAKIAGRDRMIGALEAIKRATGIEDPHQPAALATLKISGKSKWSQLFSTHPNLEIRIAALKQQVV